jgi:hypothetical protein
MRSVGDRADGHRLRALIALLWRAGMDRWAWEQLDPWLQIRRQLPIDALLCVIHGPTAGRRQLGHANLGITSIYLQGIDSSEIISTGHGRPSPTISASAGLRMRR